MTKPSPLNQEFWGVFGELFSFRLAGILNPTHVKNYGKCENCGGLCEYGIVELKNASGYSMRLCFNCARSLALYPDKTSPLIDKCGHNHGKGGIVDVALDLPPSRGDLNKLTG